MSFDFGEPKEVDPTADFLAREREAAGVLSGDADLFGSSTGAAASAADQTDFERSASAFPALDDNGNPTATSQPPIPPAALGGGFGFDHDHDQPSALEDDRHQFEKSFPELDNHPSQHSAYDTSRNEFISATAPGASSLQQSAVYTAPGFGDDDDAEEPEPVRKWREEQQESIARRDAEAERKKGEAISKAEQDIDNFYAEYNAKKEKNIAKNKEAEAKFHEERQRELAEGTTWARITKVLDLQNSQSKTIARTGPGASDLSRMKEVYLSLRREGETAPGATGY